MNPKLIVEQKITPITNQYSIYEVGAEGEKGRILAFAQQKRLAFKEKVTFYTDSTKSQEVFGFRAEKAMDIHGRFFVEDAGGKRIGAFKKNFKQSLLNSTWQILDNKDEPKITIRESNQLLAIVRRFAELIPIVGDLMQIVLAFFKYHFDFTDTKNGEVVGSYQKTTLLRDHYTLLMQDDAYKKEDWRVLAAISVALDALQAR